MQVSGRNDGARPVAFVTGASCLASEKPAYITGQTLMLDGGLTSY